MTVFVESQQFSQMLSYKPFAETKTEKKKVKYSLLDSIQQSIGDKWYRLKEGTRQAFDMVCFFSTELGFFYASDEYLAKRNGISDRTIQYRLKELVELGQVIKVYRRARKCNGRGNPVYLFVNHPYFKYWVNLLGIDMTNFQTDCETENCEKPSGSKDEEGENFPTYVLPKKQESNIYTSNNKIVQYVVNRVNDSIKKGTRIKYMSSYIDTMVTKLEWQALYFENNRQIKVQEQIHNNLYENVKDMLENKPVKKVPFYNWLQS
ncbi:hypothetical protein QP810_10925 [Streptococcus agalactiae]|uniref:hypothetical protein n=1 Tax=Streptococcus agalactiae TaxID=1311 RepID=UPI00255373DD|nr:hypothetical protein [Streptococcus agalactiae]MDK8747729.1 hypothetical protein [Streptococcus agalactiae]